MEVKFNLPSLEELHFIKINAKKPFLVSNNNNGKSWRLTNSKIKRESGIYFLFNKNKELIYVGETENLLNRISNHRRTTLGTFYLKFFKTECSKSLRKIYEKLYILSYSPKYQQMTTENRRYYGLTI